MNFIIKTIIKKVFQKYLNLEEQLNVESGHIKLPFGKINQEEINKKLQPFNIQISDSIYRNLSISIPLTQITSKPIKISIERFQVLIGKRKTNNKKNQQEKQENEKLTEPPSQVKGKMQIEQEVSKYSKNMPAGKEQVNSGYIKNMVNRLLYNMEILFEKIVIKMQKDEQGEDSQGVSKYLEDVQFEITNLHLRNSLVLLEANIIKKIFNLQQVLIRHKFAELIVKDLNICLDYNNRKFNLMAILGNIIINVKSIPYQEIQQFLIKKNQKKPSSQSKSQSEPKKQQNAQVTNLKPNNKQKPIQLDIYLKVTQSTFQVENLLSLRGEMLQFKFKNYQNHLKSQLKPLEKNIELQVMFKNLCFVHHNEEPFEQKDFIMIRYLPWCSQVKTFSQYEDNILKSALIKFAQKETYQKQLPKVLSLKKKQSDLSESLTFDDRREDAFMNEYIKREFKIQVYYIEIVFDMQIARKVIGKIFKNPHLKFIVQMLNKKPENNDIVPKQMFQVIESHEKNQRIQIQTEFVVYRLMINVNLLNQFSIKLYGSFRGGYTNNQSHLDNPSATESSIYGSRPGHASEYIYSHSGKHTHKKRNSNKQIFGKQSSPLKQKQKSQSKGRTQSKKFTKAQQNHEVQQYSSQQFHLEFIQMCLQCKQYRVVDLGTLSVNMRKNTSNPSYEIVVAGTTLNTELSIKLITDIIKLVPILQKLVKQITCEVDAFLNPIAQNRQIVPEMIQLQNSTKSQKSKLKICFYLKLNEINVKLGSLIQRVKSQNSERIVRRQDFVEIFLLQISSLSFGTKSLKSFKLKFQTMIFLTSPQTLHKTFITKSPIGFKIQRNKNKQIAISLVNDLQIDLDQTNTQILVKYFAQIGQNLQKEEMDEREAIQNAQRLSDNDCYLIQFYNSTSKQIKIIQTNEYEVSEDSLNLSELEDSSRNPVTSEDYRFEQKISTLKGKHNKTLFLLNQFSLFIEIDGYKSHPINLQFKPVPIKNVNTPNQKYYFQYEEILKFEEDIEKIQNRYVIHFLLNSIQKVQKIVLKQNVSVMSYKDFISFQHQNSQSIAYSNLILKNIDQKITDDFVLNLFRSNYHVFDKPSQHSKELDINYGFLIDLNEEHKQIVLTKGNNQSKNSKFKVSGLLLRSPNTKVENSLYSLFGIYRDKQTGKQNNQAETIQTSTNCLLESYLYQIKYLQSHYFVQMPFLIIENSLPCSVQLDIFDKKTQILRSIKLNAKQKQDLYPGQLNGDSLKSFDFYNKQFTMKIKMISKKKNQSQQPEEQIMYESQDHYFNTFFMVEHQFETLITLRSNQKYQFDKKYLFLKEELMLKTKVLKLLPPCRIINKTNFNFGLKFKRHQLDTLPQVKSPHKLVTSQNETQKKPQICSPYIIVPEEEQNNHIVSSKNSEIEIVNQFRANQVIQILFDNLQETKIQVQQEMSKQANILILSFNFAQKDKKLAPYFEKEHKYCHLLFRLRVKTIDNHQFIVIENFITFRNLSRQNLSLSLEPQKIISANQEVIFPLPPTTNHKFNNRAILLNSVLQIQPLYQQLFSFGFDDRKKVLSKKSLRDSTQKLDPSSEKNIQSHFLTIKNPQINQTDENILLKDLVYSKNNLKQVNLGVRGIKLFSLLKDSKSGIIRLFFLQKLFNPNLSYLLLNNDTQKKFLISNDKSEYTHHFVKNSSQKRSLFDDSKQEAEEQNAEKIFIHKKTFSVMSNQEDFQLLLCDENGKHLEKSTKANLEKENLQMEFHTTGNFQLIDISEIPKPKNKEASSEAKVSIKTRMISLNINLYGKLFLNFSILNLSLRLLEEHKMDCLVQDIALKNCLNNEHILRIPEESYVLFEGKKVGKSQDAEFILVKNLFVKCRNIIVNLEKDLTYRTISLFKKLLPQNKNQDRALKKQVLDNESVRQFFETIQANQSLSKLKDYLKQKLFLVKNLYIHEIHLSLSLDLESNNFSNVMVIPHYELVNSFMREKSLMKEVGEFYKTNILAKLPKLSFIFQNMKSPLNLLRTMVKVSNALNQKIEVKNVLTFDHDQIPENDLEFSLQRWNFMHKRAFARSDPKDEEQAESQELLTFLFKNECYYLVSNKSFIILSLNSRNLPKESQGTFVHYESSEESLGLRLKDKWVRTYENSIMRIISLKDLQKIKLIRNKKYSELAIHFKGNVTFNICDQYEKCVKLIDTINSIVM